MALTLPCNWMRQGTYLAILTSDVNLNFCIFNNLSNFFKSSLFNALNCSGVELFGINEISANLSLTVGVSKSNSVSVDHCE